MKVRANWNRWERPGPVVVKKEQAIPKRARKESRATNQFATVNKFALKDDRSR